MIGYTDRKSTNKVLPGYIIRDRYIVGHLIDKGTCGQVYKIVDLQNRQVPLAIKVTEQSDLFEMENQIKRQVWKKSCDETIAKMM